MRFELRHIKYFTALAEELHFRRTAERLNVAQPALSRTIQHLENEIGVLLFERTNRSVKLTEAGQVFLDGCKGIIHSVEAAVENARQVDSGLLGRLRIGYTDFAITGVLPKLLKDFHKTYPDITLQPHNSVTSHQLELLEEGSLDLGFVTGEIHQPGYQYIPIQTEPYLCLVYETHPLAKRGKIKLSELANEDFVLGPQKGWEHFYNYLFPLCRSVGFTPNIVQEAFNSVGILGLVACGMGITILTKSTFHYTGTRVISLEIEDISEKLITSVVWKESSQNTGPKNTFIQHMEQYYKVDVSTS